MNYAKDRLEASRPKTFGKHNKVRPLTLCMQDEKGGNNAPSVHNGATSVASSRRSSDYRAVTAAARTVKLEAEAEAKRAQARLADTRAEFSEQHKIITAELEAMQCLEKESLQANNQQQTVQSAKVDALENRLEEMKDLTNQSPTYPLRPM